MDQLSFNLPEIDNSATKRSVEGWLEKYRIFMLREPDEHMPRITPSYSLAPPALTNSFHSSTEEAAIANVDYERKRRDFIKQTQKAINKLNYQERKVIIKYLQADGQFNYEIYGELDMSERQYYRVKSRAFYKLAFALRIEVYTDKKVSVV